ncbi:MAG: glycogen synthase GlgA [Candidatus Latescibacterota bacterium]|nr:MAG: glycogen synthase GlgA [Candidatus Latescibacterota bacterium]
MAKRPERVVLATTEAVPFAKAGGLADVTSALASALARLDLDVTLLLPAYPFIEREGGRFTPVCSRPLEVALGRRTERFRLHRGELPGTPVEVVLIEHDAFFGRLGIYQDEKTGAEYADAAARYAFLSRAILAALPALGPPPDILQLNDHHTALAAAYRLLGPPAQVQALAPTGVLLGIHNLGYQGIYDAEHFHLTGLPESWMQPPGALEFWGRMNFMKVGIVHADVVTTVSPTYAREIQQSERYGHGLQGVLQKRGDDLCGILNGIDVDTWDPARDLHLPAHYDVDHLAGKAVCKRALQQRCGLDPEPELPLFGLIGRLVDQKGIDVLLAAATDLLSLPIQLAVLGKGQHEYEERLLALSRARPGRVAVRIGFDEELAHWIEAACDFYLMPSRYEPCGLNQMYSLRYGTVPVARRTGGLADTVHDCAADAQIGNGFLYGPHSAEALLDAVRRALVTFQSPDQMQRLIRTGMSADFSWDASARRYLHVYRRALQKRPKQPGLRIERGGTVTPAAEGGIDTGARIRKIRADFERE